MAVTDQALLSDVQSLVAEPLDGGLTWPSEMWNAAEVLGLLDEAQQELIADTACVLKRVAIPCVPHVLRHDLPADFLLIQRLTWVRASDSRVFVLDPADIWQLDAALAAGVGNWRVAPGTPAFYTMGDVPTRTVQIAPAASVPGSLQLTYLALPTPFTGLGAVAEVPDDVTVGIVWQTLEHMLTKEVGARAHDPGRAAVAGERARMIRETVKLLLQGWEV